MKKNLFFLILISSGAYLFSAFGKNNPDKPRNAAEPDQQTFSQVPDGDKIKSIKIGGQEWMAENLNVGYFRNGDSIPEIKSEEEWANANIEGKPAWCYYDNDPKNGAKYGRLYNWFAVSDSRGLAPGGWHIPGDGEWTVLTDFLGGEKTAGIKMKSLHGWKEDGNGTDESNFSGLPGGFRNYAGIFGYNGALGYWWSATEKSAGNARGRILNHGNPTVLQSSNVKESGFSVRCLRD